MSNEITPETLREWADEADEGEEIVLGSKELRQLAVQQERSEHQINRLNKQIDIMSLGPR